MCQSRPVLPPILTKIGNYKTNKNTIATTTMPMAKL
jgi:hypothetical protein